MLLVIVASIIAADPTPPVWPDRWVSPEAQTVYVNGKPGPASTLISYFDGPNNRTALTNITKAQCDVIITDYAAGVSGKQYFIRTYGGPGAKHPVERHCQYWCEPDVGPTVCNQADSLCSDDYTKKARFVGTAEVNGVETNKFFWGENLGPIPMNSLILYATTDTSPQPLRLDRSLHPFGKALGNTTLLFNNWASHPAAFDESIFDLGPDAKYACSDPNPSDQCQQAQAELRAWRQEQQQL